MGGLTIHAQGTLDDANNADAVIVGSGIMTRDIIKNKSIMNRINLNPSRQSLAPSVPEHCGLQSLMYLAIFPLVLTLSLPCIRGWY